LQETLTKGKGVVNKGEKWCIPGAVGEKGKRCVVGGEKRGEKAKE